MEPGSKALRSSNFTGVRERSTLTLLHLAELSTRFWNIIRCYTLVPRLISLKGKGFFCPPSNSSELKKKKTKTTLLLLCICLQLLPSKVIVPQGAHCTAPMQSLFQPHAKWLAGRRGVFMGRPLLLQSCCVPAEGAAPGPGLILELLREVAQMLFVVFFSSLKSFSFPSTLWSYSMELCS